MKKTINHNSKKENKESKVLNHINSNYNSFLANVEETLKDAFCFPISKLHAATHTFEMPGMHSITLPLFHNKEVLEHIAERYNDVLDHGILQMEYSRPLVTNLAKQFVCYFKNSIDINPKSRQKNTLKLSILIRDFIFFMNTQKEIRNK